MTSMLTRERPIRPAQAPDRPTGRPQSQVIQTRAELAECTCPEHCERDHTDG